jgi:hypothetical protein
MRLLGGRASWTKDEASVYEAGPTRRWLKVKQKGWTVKEDRWQRRMFARTPATLDR